LGGLDLRHHSPLPLCGDIGFLVICNILSWNLSNLLAVEERRGFSQKAKG